MPFWGHLQCIPDTWGHFRGIRGHFGWIHDIWGHSEVFFFWIRAICGHLRPFSDHLWSFWGHFWWISAIWGHLGSIFGCSVAMRPSVNILWTAGAISYGFETFAAIRGHFGWIRDIWGHFEAFFRPFVVILKPIRLVWRHPLPFSGRFRVFCGHLGPFSEHSGPFWCRFGAHLWWLCDIWGHVRSFGTMWGHLGPCGAILGPCGATFPPIITCAEASMPAAPRPRSAPAPPALPG